LALAKKMGDKEFEKEWKALPAQIKKSFVEMFYLTEEGYLADYIDSYGKDTAIRCNQIVACGLPNIMLNEEQIVNILVTVRQHLLTPAGLRSLSPLHPMFESTYKENPIEQEAAATNGAVWVWPLMFYVECALKLDGERFLPVAEEMLAAFDDNIQTYCIGSVAEYYDANPPFAPRGAISQAWSVAGVLYIKQLVEKYKAKAKRATKRTATKKSVKNNKK
jgi:glycogen debranching enzyme